MADIWLSSLKPKAYETIHDLNRTNYQLQEAAAPWKNLLFFVCFFLKSQSMQTYCRQTILSFSLKGEFPCKAGYRSHPPDTSSSSTGTWKHSTTWILNFQLTSFSQRLSTRQLLLLLICCGHSLCVLLKVRTWCRCIAKLVFRPPHRTLPVVFSRDISTATWCLGGMWSDWSCCWCFCMFFMLVAQGELECVWPELSEKCSGYPIGTSWLKRFGVSVRS